MDFLSTSIRFTWLISGILQSGGHLKIELLFVCLCVCVGGGGVLGFPAEYSVLMIRLISTI